MNLRKNSQSSYEIRAYYASCVSCEINKFLYNIYNNNYVNIKKNYF